MEGRGQMIHRHPSIATPALFARTASRGHWRLPRHLACLDRVVCDAIAGRTKRQLIVTLPPRHGKSEYISRYLPAWYRCQFPDHNIMQLSHTARLAMKYSRAVRNLTREYGQLWGVTLSDDVRSAEEWETSAGGAVKSAGVRGSISGRGGHLLIVDDPIGNAEQANSETYREGLWDWWGADVYSRLSPDPLVIVMHTRWHQQDLVGRLLERDPDGWRVINLPAIAEENDELGRKPGEALWPSQFPLSRLEYIRDKGVSPYAWQALYQQRPSRFERFEFPDSYFSDIWAPEGAWPDTFDARAIALDPSKGKDAKRGDYSAIVFAGLARGLIWVDADIARRPVPDIARDSYRCVSRWGCDRFGVETNQFQELMVGVLDQQAKEYGHSPLPIATINNHAKKEIRIQGIGTYMQRGMLRVRPSAGGKLLVHQTREFPLGQHDDGPDALEMAIRLLRHLRS